MLEEGGSSETASALQYYRSSGESKRLAKQPNRRANQWSYLKYCNSSTAVVFKDFELGSYIVSYDVAQIHSNVCYIGNCDWSLILNDDDDDHADDDDCDG